MRTNTRKKPLMATGILIAALALLLAPGPGMATPEVDDDGDDGWVGDDGWMVPTAPGAGHEPDHVTAASAAQAVAATRRAAIATMRGGQNEDEKLLSK